MPMVNENLNQIEFEKQKKKIENHCVNDNDDNIIWLNEYSFQKLNFQYSTRKTTMKKNMHRMQI